MPPAPGSPSGPAGIPLTGANAQDPALRDTATIMFAPTGDIAGWAALRFVASNAGVWPLHCKQRGGAMLLRATAAQGALS